MITELDASYSLHSEHHQESLRSELQMVQGRELQLLSARGRLEEELSCVRGELEGYQKQLEVCQKQLEVRGVELSKMRVHNQTLNKKIKVCALRYNIINGSSKNGVGIFSRVVITLLIICLTHANVWESVGKPCSCT